MENILGYDFFNRDTRMVARELLGSYLVRQAAGGEIAAMITETEAYDGFRDKASHASRGRTPRNQVMFGRPGVWYVYLCYGMHHLLNVVTREEGYPAGVLIRAIMADGRTIRGPGRVTAFLGVEKSLYGKPAEKTSGLWVQGGMTVPRRNIIVARRIGVDYAGPVWAAKKWRFTLKKT